MIDWITASPVRTYTSTVITTKIQPSVKFGQFIKIGKDFCRDLQTHHFEETLKEKTNKQKLAKEDFLKKFRSRY